LFYFFPIIILASALFYRGGFVFFRKRLEESFIYYYLSYLNNMDLDSLTQENWKQLAPTFAKEIFPIDSLVAFRYALRENFGKVKKITASGMVVVTPGELKEVSRKLSGAYLEVDYNPTTFSPKPYQDKSLIRFTPFYFTSGGEQEISWHRSEAGILKPLKPNENKLVHDTQLNY